MSVISFKEDGTKANIIMDEGDSSLEPGEVKTPPHGVETTKPKEAESAIKIKCNASQYLPHTKSASKQETDKCAEKVRAILELDAIKRKEELERKKEQKSDTTLDKRSTKGKDHKKRKNSKRESKDESLEDYGSENVQDAVIKKTKHKKSKHTENKRYPKHLEEGPIESMRPIGSAALSPLSFATPVSNISKHFSRRISDLNNPPTFRSFNPFMRNYRTDFRHRSDNFVPHNRGRFSRYHSQYVSGPFHSSVEDSSQPQSAHFSLPHSQLQWTKIKPSISYAFNLHNWDTVQKNRKSSDHNVQKRKKNKKSKDREGSNRSMSSSKSSHKSSKRKKIRKIRETLMSQPVKNQLPSPKLEPAALISADNGSTPEYISNKSKCPMKNTDIPQHNENGSTEVVSATFVQSELKEEVSKLMGNVAGDTNKSDVIDMFACLTPPKQKSPALELDIPISTSSNEHITNKFQEIHDRIDKLLEDDEFKLENIQATKEKLLQKSRAHTENINASKSSKKNKNSNSIDSKITPNIVQSHEKLIEKSIKHRSKERDKTGSTSSDTQKEDRKHVKDQRKSTSMKSLHSRFLSNTPHKNNKTSKNSVNVKDNPSKKNPFTLKKSSLEDSPSNLIDGSPDTDDYSDNWENDDEEIDISSAFQNINQLGIPKKNTGAQITGSSPSLSIDDNVDSDSEMKIQSTTPKNSPPQQCLSPKLSYTPTQSPNSKVDCPGTDEMQRLYNQFIECVENADIKPTQDLSSDNDPIVVIKQENETEQMSTSSASYSSSCSSSSDTSISSSGSSSSTSSSDSASDDSNDGHTYQKSVSPTASNYESTTENSSTHILAENEKTLQLLTTTSDSKPSVAKDLKKLENLEANLLRIQMMRANYDSADEISDELLKMEKLFLHEKNIILNKFMDSSMSKSIKKEIESNSESDVPMQPSIESLQSASLSKGQFVQSLQKLPNKDDNSLVTNIFDTNREVIKLTISPVKLPKTSAIFEADNDMDSSKQALETCEKSNSTVKPPKPIKEVAIVKPIMESKEPPSHHQHKRRRSPLQTHHTLQSRARSRRGRVRSLSVSPPRNNSGRSSTPQRRGGFPKFSRARNYERRSRSRSRSPSNNRSLSRRSGEISPVPRKRRSLINMEDRFRKHSPRRDSRSRSRSRSPSRHRCDRYSRSPLPFKPPSPPTDPNSSPIGSRRSSLSPDRRSRSNSRSPNKRDISPSKSYESNRHRSLSPKHRLYKPHSPRQNNTTSSYYFNHSPNRISLDARLNIVLNGPSSSHNENTNSIATYEEYSHYSQYGPAAYMSLPSDSNSFYTNQYVPMANAGPTVPPTHAMQLSYPNIPAGTSDESELFTSVPHHGNVNPSNFYYNRFGTQPFGLNQQTSVLKELPKATVAVQKGNVLEIVPCGDLISHAIAEHTNENENQNKTGVFNQQTIEEATSSNCEKGKRSILKEGDSNSLRSSFVGTPKKKKVNFEDGVFPNHNSDDEDRKVIEAKMRVKMRRLRKKLGITPPCYKLFEDKARKERQKANSDKRPPPPTPNGLAPPSLEQPIYLRTHTPTPLLYFHFDGVVHSMYVSQMERPIPPRLLNPKCLSTTNISLVSNPTDTQSPLYMQSPISAGAPHLPTSKKDSISTFTRPNRAENISPKVIPSTLPAALQQSTGSPKINFKMYSPIESMHHTEISSATLPNTSPNSIKGNTIHTIPPNAMQSHFLPKRQEPVKDNGNARTNMSMGLLPVPITHPPLPVQNSGITAHTRIPVIGVPPTVIPKLVPSVTESFMGGFGSTMIQTPPIHPINNINQNYMVPPSMAHPNPHMPGGAQQYFNPPIQRMHRPLPNYMITQAQQSPTLSNLPMCHMVDPMDAANGDLDKFANSQAMAIPYNFKGP